MLLHATLNHLLEVLTKMWTDPIKREHFFFLFSVVMVGRNVPHIVSVEAGDDQVLVVVCAPFLPFSFRENFSGKIAWCSDEGDVSDF